MPLSLPDPVEYAVKRFRTDGMNLDYDRYRRYLNGDHPLQFAGPKYRSAFGSLFEAFAYDRTNMVVNAHVDRLKVTGFTARNKGVGKRAQELWDRNSMDKRENDLEREYFGMGDGYVIVEKHPVTGRVNIWPNKAANMRVYYSDEQPGEIEFAVKAWLLNTGYLRLNIYRRGFIDKYITVNRAPAGMPMSTKAFERYEVADEPWPVPTGIVDTVPVFHIANDAWTGEYGVSELKHVIPLQNALNKAVTDLLVAMETGAFPQRAILGVDPGPEPDAASVAKMQRYELGIDRILEVVGQNAKIAEFQAIALAQFIASAEFLDTTISRVTRVPVHWLKMTGDFPSGTALRMAESPYISKLENRQSGSGEVIGNIQAYALRLDGVADPGEVTPVWKSAAPRSIEEEMELALQKQSLGIPLEYILRGVSDIEDTDIPKIIALKEAAVKDAMRSFDAGRVPAGFADEDEGQAA